MEYVWKVEAIGEFESEAAAQAFFDKAWDAVLATAAAKGVYLVGDSVVEEVDDGEEEVAES